MGFGLGFCGVLWGFVGFCGVLWGFVGFCGVLWGFQLLKLSEEAIFEIPMKTSALSQNPISRKTWGVSLGCILKRRTI